MKNTKANKTNQGSGATGTGKDASPALPPVGIPVVFASAENKTDEQDLETMRLHVLESMGRLHLSGMKGKYLELMQELPLEEMAQFTRIFSLITNAEDTVRDTNKVNRLIHAAGLQIQNACLEDIVMVEGRHFSVDTLQLLGTCEYIANHRHVLLTGATGSGKTYFSNALATSACRKGYRVKFTRLPDLLYESDLARKEGTYSKFRNSYTRQNLIVVDEWLLRPLSYEESLQLFDFIDACSYTSSMIFCSQFPPKDWYTRIDYGRNTNTASTLAEAVLDRIIHNAYLLHIDSKESMRKHYSNV